MVSKENSNPYMLSDIYNKYPHIILLHSLSRKGALDREERELIERIQYIPKSDRICTHPVIIDRPFDRISSVGVIIEEAEIIAVKEGDGGTLNPSTEAIMEKADMEKKLAHIYKNGFDIKYSEIIVSKPQIYGFYILSELRDLDYLPLEVRDASERRDIKNICGLDQKTGKINFLEWNVNEYKIKSQINNRFDLFTVK